MPLAYWPDATNTATQVLDLLVCSPLRQGLQLGIRFYPHDSGYLSGASTSVAFVLRAAVPAGAVLRLQRQDGGDGVMLLNVRLPPTETAWVTVASSTSAPVITFLASVFVYWATDCSSVNGLCALGLRDTALVSGGGTDPVLPPACVVPCQFAVVQDGPPADVDEPQQWYIAATEGTDPSNALAVPGSWLCGAWLALKWGAAWRAANDVTDPYVVAVDALEDAMYVQLQPGQLAAVAYRPYDPVGAPAFAAQWVLVVTATIPPATTVYIRGNDWPGADTSAADAWWVWTSPASCPTPPGSVIDCQGLGPPPTFSSPRASVGYLALGDAHPTILPGTALYAFTAYSAARDAGDAPLAHPITATLPCAYRGTVPAGLVPGDSMLAHPWPDCASLILSAAQCTKGTATWTMRRIALAHACPVRWTCQPAPSFLPLCPGACGVAGCGSCACGPAAPLGVCLSTPAFVGPSGCGLGRRG